MTTPAKTAPRHELQALRKTWKERTEAAEKAARGIEARQSAYRKRPRVTQLRKRREAHSLCIGESMPAASVFIPLSTDSRFLSGLTNDS